MLCEEIGAGPHAIERTGAPMDASCASIVAGTQAQPMCGTSAKIAAANEPARLQESVEPTAQHCSQLMKVSLPVSEIFFPVRSRREFGNKQLRDRGLSIDQRADFGVFWKFCLYFPQVQAI
jgi:hypothetical protein